MGTYDSSNRGDAYLKWDPSTLDIRTKSVERTLQPLVAQVTTLMRTSDGVSGSVTPSGKKKGRSKRAHVLVAAVERAIQHFLERGMEIVEANPEARQQLLPAVDQVRVTGDEMGARSREFADDPCVSDKRRTMVDAARALLTAVTRLLIIADMIDVHLIMNNLQLLEGELEGIQESMSHQELMERFGKLNSRLDLINAEAARRAADLKDPRQSDDLAAARALLKKNNTMLQTASKALVRHPEVDPARENRDWACGEVRGGIRAMQNILDNVHPGENGLRHGEVGQLASALDSFGREVYIDPSHYKSRDNRPTLEEALERIISGAALIADSASTREDRKTRIVAECNALRQALQDLLSEYESNAGRKEPSESLDLALLHLSDKTRDLRRHLRRAVVDHISDSFLDTSVPLMILIEAAKQGDAEHVEEYGALFLQHATKLVEVANLACQMSNNEDGVKMVHYAAMQVHKLAPQVVNAARLLCSRPQSKVAQENMEAFREAWEERVRVLTLAVDSIITVDDFLAVSEAHILEDVNSCVGALKTGNAEGLDRTAGAIRGRTLRVCDVVEADVETRVACGYTERIREAVRVVRDDVLPSFSRKAETAVDCLSRDPQEPVDAEDFINSASLVYDGVKEIRNAVLMNREIDDIDSDEEYEVEIDKASVAASDVEGPDEKSARALMRDLPVEEKKQIQVQVNLFNLERQRFDREVAKWDDTGNDIIVLAKYMCMIMMEMTDFTRGRGPLKTTMDVINAAKKISEAGTKLNTLAKKVAEESVESATKKDLVAYMQRITLYCHQLNITSKVKADVQQVGDELVVSGLESATSLIQSAKNLLSAVVLTVKAAYIASTKYPSKAGKPVPMVWKMAAPDKKPLYRKDSKAAQQPGIIRRASQRRELPPIKVLSQFHADNV